LFALLEKLASAGTTRELFDYALQRLLSHDLLGLPPRDRADLDDREAIERLLANVARYGHRDTAAAEAAFSAGLDALRMERAPRDARLPSTGSFADLDAALGRLARLSPRAKRTLLAAVLAVIRHDRTVTSGEAELF